ncbi:uncharacterized protein LOC131156374 isoform X2 [Malania oleifera]|uniref:uncharacterized protein LOC131156374 isoform X2 n=1 Tax=Malania oleifera TaxID=397392 RepID=UPI0025ADFEBF|nr:uncharacterized protein LOC131156374 isoform X2 [Malania oleifera]
MRKPCECGKNFLKGQELCLRFVYDVLNPSQSHWSNVNNVETNAQKEPKDASEVPLGPKAVRKTDYDSGFKNGSDDDGMSGNKWRLELAWLTKALEPALQLCRWALPTGTGTGNSSPPTSRSVSEILASIQCSKVGIQDWSLSDLTIGLYLIYLRQASANPFEDVNGVQISSDLIVQDLIYHSELAKGAYKDNVAGLARNSMLRERNIVKYVKKSSVMRPGYYIGIDTRKKLVVLGIRGTHTIYDLITDIVTSSDGEVTFEGYSTHFGTAEAARWFLSHEIATIRKCLDKHEGFRLRLVGHSLGGATASLLAIMLRKKSSKELGFSPDIISAIGYATPPCVSRELAESCADYVTTVVMQDDIIPRLSVAALMRLRNEIVQTDWVSVIDKEDWKNVLGLVTNAKQVVSSVQDVARKLADYAKFRSKTNSCDLSMRKELSAASTPGSTFNPEVASSILPDKDGSVWKKPEELFVPGTLYYLKRNIDTQNGECRKDNSEGGEFFTLWKRHPGEHFQRIVLSSNLFSDHKCDNHYYALRDVLKGLPRSADDFFPR